MIDEATGGDVVVRIPLPEADPSPQSPGQTRYDALVYSRLPLHLDTPWIRRAPQEFIGLPLQGCGQLTIPTGRYQDYLASFLRGGRSAAEEMYFRLRTSLSRDLLAVLDQAAAGPPAPQAGRLWWANEAPELDDLPWDLVFYGFGQKPQTVAGSFVRGAPPQTPPPILPLRGDLRLAWCDTRLTPDWLRDLLKHPLPGVRPIPMPLNSREGLHQAAAEGYEMVHLASDGIVSLAYEGVLYDHGDWVSPELTAPRTSSLLSGSRVSVIGLSVQDHDPDTMKVQGRHVASAYRAFARYASARVALPSIVAPIGPTDDQLASDFWAAFYQAVGTTHRLDTSLAQARQKAPESTFALFLRHTQGKLFRSVDRRRGPERPELLHSELRTSHEGMQRLDTLRGKYGTLPDYLEAFAEGQGERQKSIEDSLAVWSQLDEDEK